MTDGPTKSPQCTAPPTLPMLRAGMLSCLHVLLHPGPDRDRLVSAITKKPKPTGSEAPLC